MQESNPIIKAKRRAGRVKRYVKRKVYERNIGKQYKAWLTEAATVEPEGWNDPAKYLCLLMPLRLVD